MLSQYRHTLLYRAYRCGFSQTEGRTLHEQKDYALLYCDGLAPNLQYL